MKALVQYMLYGGFVLIVANLVRVLILGDELLQIPPPWRTQDVLIFSITFVIFIVPLPKLLRAIRDQR
jgi:hypothetical protein